MEAALGIFSFPSISTLEQPWDIASGDAFDAVTTRGLSEKQDSATRIGQNCHGQTILDRTARIYKLALGKKSQIFGAKMQRNQQSPSNQRKQRRQNLFYSNLFMSDLRSCDALETGGWSGFGSL